MRAALAALALSLIAAPALAAADGAQVFTTTCKVCHGAKSTPMGPSLTGVAGAKIATRAGFTYSPALQKAKAKGAWTDQNLDAFLSGPTKFAPGTRMPISVADAEKRAAVIAYLKTQK